MKKLSLITILFIVFVTSIILFGGLNVYASQNFMSLATASMGGTYYIVGSGLAEIIAKNVPEIKINATIAQGSVGNPKLVDSMEADLGMTNYWAASKAIKGEEPYEKKLNISGICPLQFSILQLTTFTKKEDINTVADLKGKRIAVGPAGGGGVKIFKTILPFWDLNFDDIIPSYISYGEGSDALRDGNVDVTMPHGAPPLQAISRLTLQHKIKIISLEEDKLSAINQQYPYFEKTIIPANTYKGIKENITSVGCRDILIVNSSISDDIVYKITEAIYNHLQDLRAIHPSIKNISFDGYKNSLLPLHPGAKKFYDEMNIKTQ